VDCQNPQYLLQLGMSFLYLPLFCQLSNTLISAPAGNVVPLPSTILWIVKIPYLTIHKIMIGKGRTLSVGGDIKEFDNPQNSGG
jgi:hypothetical protein